MDIIKILKSLETITERLDKMATYQDLTDVKEQLISRLEITDKLDDIKNNVDDITQISDLEKLKIDLIDELATKNGVNNTGNRILNAINELNNKPTSGFDYNSLLPNILKRILPINTLNGFKKFFNVLLLLPIILLVILLLIVIF